jgi:hypothetical protein
MIPITNSDDASTSRYELERALLDTESRQLLVGDEVTAVLDRHNCELSVEWGKLIFAWWNEEQTQSWRVLSYEIDQAEVRLRVSRGMGRETTVLTLRDPVKWRAAQESENLGLDQRRKLFGELLAKLLTASFNGARVQRSTTGAYRAHSVPGKFARLTLQLNQEKVFVIGVNKAESSVEIDSIVAAGLIWLANFNDGRTSKQRVKRLWFCLPRGCAQTAIERLTLIDLSHLDAFFECFEVDEENETLIALRPATQDELLNDHPRELRWPTGRAFSLQWRERILALAPMQIETRHRPGLEGESLSINGLEFARVMTEETPVRFGVAGIHRENSPAALTSLNESNFSELERLIREIIKYRCGDSPDRRHPYYRLRGEAWLESLIRRDILTLDTTLDQRFVYSQIPTWRGDERSVIDLLTINHEGRLVVIEVKAVEDPQLPLQGLDYWLRIEQARLRREFEKRGMFIGAVVSDQSPLLYLVAPRLRFHRTFATVARCLSPQIEAYQIGVNANWREGIHVHSRERVNSRD